MAHTLTATVGGATTNLSDGTLCYYVAQDGLGMPNVRRQTEQGPMQHGETDVGFRLEARMFRLFFDVPGADAGDVYDRRTSLLELFAPSDDPIVLRWVLPNGDTREIEAHARGGLAFPTSQRRGYVERAMVTLRAPDPRFYDPTGESEVFSLPAGGGSLTVPTPVPMPVGASTLDQTETISYAGNWEEYPWRIRIEGPITNPKVENLTTDEELEFASYAITTGQYIDIDCRHGYKTVVREDDSNIIAELSDDSDLGTFHLKTGNNDIRVTGTGAGATTQVLVQYYNRYIGI